jgi:hypothetical protein
MGSNPGLSLDMDHNLTSLNRTTLGIQKSPDKESSKILCWKNWYFGMLEFHNLWFDILSFDNLAFGNLWFDIATYTRSPFSHQMLAIEWTKLLLELVNAKRKWQKTVFASSSKEKHFEKSSTHNWNSFGKFQRVVISSTVSLNRVARFFLAQHSKTGRNIPNDHKM